MTLAYPDALNNDTVPPTSTRHAAAAYHRQPSTFKHLSLRERRGDALGLCVFNLGATGPRPDVILEMLNSAYGIQLPAGWLSELGRRVIDLERTYNATAGFTPADDRLPAFFAEEPLSSTGTVFDVANDALDAIWG